MIVDVPPETPKTAPEPDPTVATEEVLLVQLPPPASLNAVDDPTQTTAVPDIDDGRGLTVTTAVILQPVPNV